MFRISNHRIEDSSVRHQESLNKGGAFNTHDNRPDTIVIHYTAGGTLEGAIETLSNRVKKVSAHLVVGTDGEIVQLVDFNTKAWHAGESKHLGRKGLNAYSIGIELVNPGWLEKRGSHFLTWFNSLVSSENVIRATHANENSPRYWHTYTEAQITTALELCNSIAEHYPIKYIVGHDEISPGRKQDPGPAFPMARFRSYLLENRDDETAPTSPTLTKASVTASKLNFRSAPSTQAPTVTNKPLNGGTEVIILRESQGWSEIETTTKGWVRSEYIQKK